MGAYCARRISCRADIGSIALVTGAAAGVGKGLPFLGNELPVVALGLQREFENSEGRGVANFTVGFRRLGKWPVIFSAGADDEFANAALRVRGGIGCLRREALVVVIVAANDHVGIGIVKRLPQRLYFKVIAMGTAGTEERLVPKGQRAGHGMRGKISAQPFLLW